MSDNTVFPGITGRKSIDDVDTENTAVFAELEKKYTDLSVKAGVRYDDTSITPAGSLSQPSNDYSGLSANVFASYQADTNPRYFAGLGRASRVPDARELYFYDAMMHEIGTPTLEETSNTEIDLGVEKTYDSFNIKTKLFHSWLKDYIYYNADMVPCQFRIMLSKMLTPQFMAWKSAVPISLAMKFILISVLLTNVVRRMPR